MHQRDKVSSSEKPHAGISGHQEIPFKIPQCTESTAQSMLFNTKMSIQYICGFWIHIKLYGSEVYLQEAFFSMKKADLWAVESY